MRTDLDLPLFTVVTAGKRDTSQEAYESIVKGLGGMRRRVYDLIWNAEGAGATCDEIEEFLGGRHQTISARFYDLHKHGYIVDVGDRRKTRSGRNAIVWYAWAFAPVEAR